MSERGLYYGSSYERYSDSTEGSTTHKLKNAYWTTKQVVIKKFGRKEDEHVVASDSELDAKLELFNSIQKTCMDLMRIIDRYQDKICMLSQAENELGRFLKNQGSEDKTRAGKMMTAVGKSLSFSAQQRLALRVPLNRLQQEVETFRYRAISDTLQTVTSMEQRRTEYRAALLWMRDVSENLDPDTYKQLDKFRKVQAQVRKTKTKFDKFKLDSMQKVDLLAASRCNMFSHVLSLYQNTLLQFWEKTCRTMVAVADSFKGYQYYEFSMLKDLTDESRKLAELTRKRITNDESNLLENTSKSDEVEKEEVDDFDELNKKLDEIFTSEYKDDPENEIKAAMESNKSASKKDVTNRLPDEDEAEKDFIKMSQESLRDFLIPTCTTGNDIRDLFVQVSTYLGSYQFTTSTSENKPAASGSDILGFGLNDTEEQENDKAFLDDLLMPADKQMSIFDDFIGQNQQANDNKEPDWGSLFGGTGSMMSQEMMSQASLSMLDLDSNSSTQPQAASQMLAGIMPSALLDHRSQLSGLDPFGSLSAPSNTATGSNSSSQQPVSSMKDKKSNTAAWITMFADLDPLANPDTLSKKEGQITDT